MPLRRISLTHLLLALNAVLLGALLLRGSLDPTPSAQAQDAPESASMAQVADALREVARANEEIASAIRDIELPDSLTLDTPLTYPARID